MRLACLSLATLSLTLLVYVSPAQKPSSQNATSNQAAPTKIFLSSPDWLAPAGARSCPASLDVRHGAGLGQVVATERFARKPLAQELDVTVTNYGANDIVSLDVVVQLRSDKSRWLPLLSADDDLGERLSLHFDMSVKPDKEVAASWGVASSKSVAYIELSKVTYLDGLTWSAHTGSACKFAPNPMMLISSR